jgi:chorismate--pyruvate lyase
MIEDSHWLPQPPALPPALLGFVTEPGSLTERLLATGHRFAVQPLSQGSSAAHADEPALLGIAPDQQLYARHVLLTLDEVPVVYARSIARLDCPVWQPILDRGSRSLGFTLFGGLPQLQRAPCITGNWTAAIRCIRPAQPRPTASAHGAAVLCWMKPPWWYARCSCPP